MCPGITNLDPLFVACPLHHSLYVNTGNVHVCWIDLATFDNLLDFSDGDGTSLIKITQKHLSTAVLISAVQLTDNKQVPSRLCFIDFI